MKKKLMLVLGMVCCLICCVTIYFTQYYKPSSKPDTSTSQPSTPTRPSGPSTPTQKATASKVVSQGTEKFNDSVSKLYKALYMTSSVQTSANLASDSLQYVELDKASCYSITLYVPQYINMVDYLFKAITPTNTTPNGFGETFQLNKVYYGVIENSQDDTGAITYTDYAWVKVTQKTNGIEVIMKNNDQSANMSMFYEYDYTNNKILSIQYVQVGGRGVIVEKIDFANDMQYLINFFTESNALSSYASLVEEWNQGNLTYDTLVGNTSKVDYVQVVKGNITDKYEELNAKGYSVNSAWSGEPVEETLVKTLYNEAYNTLKNVKIESSLYSGKWTLQEAKQINYLKFAYSYGETITGILYNQLSSTQPTPSLSLKEMKMIVEGMVEVAERYTYNTAMQKYYKDMLASLNSETEQTYTGKVKDYNGNQFIVEYLADEAPIVIISNADKSIYSATAFYSSESIILLWFM